MSRRRSGREHNILTRRVWLAVLEWHLLMIVIHLLCVYSAAISRAQSRCLYMSTSDRIQLHPRLRLRESGSVSSRRLPVKLSTQHSSQQHTHSSKYGQLLMVRQYFITASCILHKSLRTAPGQGKAASLSVQETPKMLVSHAAVRTSSRESETAAAPGCQDAKRFQHPIQRVPWLSLQYPVLNVATVTGLGCSNRTLPRLRHSVTIT